MQLLRIDPTLWQKQSGSDEEWFSRLLRGAYRQAAPRQPDIDRLVLGELDKLSIAERLKGWDLAQPKALDHGDANPPVL
jgi:23S rRNA G2069 N7-methylase RlmK/C1962 C5-methylase RlmI